MIPTRHPSVPLWGDSLTAGSPGVGYWTYLKEELPFIQWINHGIGGDTAVSLLRRLQSEAKPQPEDRDALGVLWIGVNDVLANIVPGYGLWKAALRQPATRTEEDFAPVFSGVLTEMILLVRRAIVLSPLFVGEDPNTEFNQRLSRQSDLIESIVDHHDNCRFLNLRPHLELTTASPPQFLPINPWSKLMEIFGRVENSHYDKAAERRGLKWTCDGVHFNTRGARKIGLLVAAVVKDELGLH